MFTFSRVNFTIFLNFWVGVFATLLFMNFWRLFINGIWTHVSSQKNSRIACVEQIVVRSSCKSNQETNVYLQRVATIFFFCNLVINATKKRDLGDFLMRWIPRILDFWTVKKLFGQFDWKFKILKNKIFIVFWWYLEFW